MSEDRDLRSEEEDAPAQSTPAVSPEDDAAQDNAPGNKASRRGFIGGAIGGAVGAFAAGFAGGRATASGKDTANLGKETHVSRGLHQPGVASPVTNFANLVAFDLLVDDVASLRRLMRMWSDNIVRLMAGEPSLTDTEPELALNPSRLTVTLGIGPGFFAGELKDKKPDWLEQLPPYQIDDLKEEWSGGDLCLLIASEDPMTIAHTQRVMVKEAVDFARMKWVQTGFRNTAITWPDGTTIRNLFGQVDGTINPNPEAEAEVIFRTDPDWMNGGSTMVARRIAMNLDTWDELDRPAREIVIGRDLDTGAPLTGGEEKDEVDLEAKNELGFPVIDVAAHVRRSKTGDETQRIYRRPYNYDDPVSEEDLAKGVTSNSGLLFLTFQADIDHQYKPIQERLAQMDLLNEWTIPIGSAVFAIPPGIGARGQEYLLQELLG